MGPEDRHLHIVGGVDYPVDQVKRHRAFLEAHPEWLISVDERYIWHARRDSDGGSDTVTADDLRGLLDELEGRSG
jgi:hypothetical protein